MSMNRTEMDQVGQVGPREEELDTRVLLQEPALCSIIHE